MAAGIDLSIVTAFSLGCMWASSSGQHGLKKPPKIINDDAESLACFLARDVVAAGTATGAHVPFAYKLFGQVDGYNLRYLIKLTHVVSASC